ncbi:radical SAM protein with 4Fe4S-binding SPASM domain [Ruminiclostridium sufflavum DSM 19573]|uniref:Radical SAM protein with 4Fe4S-binding SPASM domain n=1 Tax=Ruminiclostridium sufflavum DSM 19573 TaxID=1121337 RepID=A0A318XLR8_9FIRM|nr:radical SAM protein [Ruminiclostridium sufflavum]PYG86619.1 radical SAM protein with 4Fe4S-binding SPASM domain [Ruminiclostridium sufflavum DSM 19573]
MSVNYSPITGVWEITMGCNMRCKHCGSSCESPLEGELTTEEALRLCDDIAGLGFKWITLSGGEPTTRKDWDIIAKRLNDNGVIPNMITNGWLMNGAIAKRAKTAGVNTVALSLDGLKNTHDYIRKEGSYDKIMSAIDVLTENGLNCSVITTINNINIKELYEIHDILSQKNIFGWQLQLGLPMGNMSKNSELVTQPHHIDEVIDFAYNAMNKGGIEIQLADCIGYFNKKEIEIRRKAREGSVYSWNGCAAGKYGLGILHNGDVVGCTSIRNKDFIEGNIREIPLKALWNNPENFSWNRNMTKDKLSGICQKCLFGSRCLGGCGNTKLTIGKSVYSENIYCSYNHTIKKAEAQFERLSDIQPMLEKAKKFAENNSYQLAELLLSRILLTEPENEEVLKLYGYVSFMLENYRQALEANERLIRKHPSDPYINKGYGLSIAKLGDADKGIQYLQKAIELSDKQYLDPFNDLAVILCENGRYGEALSVLENGRSISKDFRQESESLYQMLKKQMNYI